MLIPRYEVSLLVTRLLRLHSLVIVSRISMALNATRSVICSIVFAMSALGISYKLVFKVGISRTLTESSFTCSNL